MFSFLSNVAIFLLIFWLLVPNQAGCQREPDLRRTSDAWEINKRPSISPFLPLNSHDGRYGFERIATNSPSYQHKLMQRNSGIQEYNPRKLYMNHYLLSKLMPRFPITPKTGKVDGEIPNRKDSAHSLDNADPNFWATIGAENRPEFLNPDEPNYHPYVATQAFTNIKIFFQQVRENLGVVRNEKHQDASQANVVENKREVCRNSTNLNPSAIK